MPDSTDRKKSSSAWPTQLKRRLAGEVASLRLETSTSRSASSPNGTGFACRPRGRGGARSRAGAASSSSVCRTTAPLAQDRGQPRREHEHERRHRPYARGELRRHPRKEHDDNHERLHQRPHALGRTRSASRSSASATAPTRSLQGVEYYRGRRPRRLRPGPHARRPRRLPRPRHRVHRAFDVVEGQGRRGPRRGHLGAARTTRSGSRTCRRPASRSPAG